MTVATVINPNTPYGLQPLTRLDGAAFTGRTRKYWVPQAQTNALYVGDPVIKVNTGGDKNGIMAVDLASAGASDLVTGVVVGFLGTATAGSGNTPSLFGLSGTPGPCYRPATTAVDWYVVVCDDYSTEWIIQADANYGGVTGTAIPLDHVGYNIELKSGTGSAYTGLSGWQADSNATLTTNTGQLNIIGFYTDPSNAALAQYQKLIVRLNQTTEVPPSAGV